MADEAIKNFVKIIGTQNKAIAALFTALLSTLVKEGALSKEAVQNDILGKLRENAARIRADVGAGPDLHADAMMADTIDSFTNVIEKWLFEK